MTMLPRCVLIERPTEYQELLARHGTREQAAFFLTQRGGTIEEIERRHQQYREYHGRVRGAVPAEWRRAGISRADLDRFLFEPDDIIVVLGQDGLVANVAKYLIGQPVIGLNPHPDLYPGVLVNHAPEAADDLLRDAAEGRASLLVQGSRVKRRFRGVGVELGVGWWCVRAVDGAGVVRAGAQPYFGPRPSGWFRGRRHDV